MTTETTDGDSNVLNIQIETLKFSNRTNSRLVAPLGAKTLGDLIQHTADTLMAIRGFGRKCLTEVREKLAEYNLKLNGD